MNQIKTSIRSMLIVAGMCIGTAALAAPSYSTPTSSKTPDQTMPGSSMSKVTTDQDITRQVKSRLSSMSNLKDATIDVSTMDGKVTLTGTVPSKDEEKAAKSAAESIPGVKKVDDDLHVSKSSSPSSSTGSSGGH